MLVPSAVWREIVTEGEGKPGAKELEEAREAGWATAEGTKSTEPLKLLSRELGAGEAEAIALANQHPDHILLVDEAVVREVAEVYELEKTGIVGLLLRARLEDEVPLQREALRELREQEGFWIDDELDERVLEPAGETQMEEG